MQPCCCSGQPVKAESILAGAQVLSHSPATILVGGVDVDHIFGGRYQTLELLADHDGVKTWRGLDRETQQPVAIKALNVHAVPNATVLELFERQGAVLKGIRHPAIPAFRAALEDNVQGAPHKVLVTEWVEGQNLEQWVKGGGTLTAKELLDLGIAAAQILEDLHARIPPVVHRDVKPQNLLRTAAGSLHLVDFGSVKTSSSAQSASRGATLVGTYGYMAPEQYSGDTRPASDVHALGMTLLYLVTHTHPWDFGDGGPRRAMEQLEGVSLEFRDALLDLTHPDLSRRPKNGAEARQRLEDVRQGKRPKRKSPVGLIAAGAAVAALLVAGQVAYFITARGHVEQPYPHDPPVPPIPPKAPTKAPPILAPTGEDKGFLVMPIWLGAAERCWLRAVPRVLDARWRYTSWTNLEDGPNCKERYISYGVYEAYDDAPGVCEDAAERAPEELQAVVAAVGQASAKAVPLLRKADRYYDDGRYKDDGCKGARALHGELVEAFAAMVKAGAALEEMLGQQETAALKEALARHQKAGRTVEASAVKVVAAYQQVAAMTPRWPGEAWDAAQLAARAQAVLDAAEPLEELKANRAGALAAGTQELVATVVSGTSHLRNLTRSHRDGRLREEKGQAFDPLKVRVPFHDMMTSLYLWAETRW